MIHRLTVIYALLMVIAGEPSLFAADWYHVRWVNDGDTIVLSDGRHVRYIGIDAPEMAYAEKAAEPFAEKSKQYNRNLTLGKQVKLEYDQDRYDNYGRLLAYVFLRDGAFVNQSMLQKGLAHYYQKKPNIRQAKKLLQAQKAAMRAKVGIWAGYRIGRTGPFDRLRCRFQSRCAMAGHRIAQKRSVPGPIDGAFGSIHLHSHPAFQEALLR